MQRSLTLAGLAAVAALAVFAVAPAGGATKVLFPGNCGKPTYKPTSIIVTCGDANNRVVRIKWESYGTTAASGKGTALVNDCDPNCASGHAVRSPAVVTLTKPKDCGTYTQFTKLVETFTGAKPGSTGSKVTEKFPCGGNS
jgi:hypothetical protein